MALIHITLVSTICVFNALFGYAVFRADHKSRQNQLFAALCGILSIWLLFDFSLYQQDLADYQTVLNRTNLAVVCYLIVILINFIRVFPREVYRMSQYIYYAVDVLFIGIGLFTQFSNQVVKTAFMEDYGSNFVQGDLFNYYIAYTTILTVFVMGFLIAKYYRLEGQHKIQFKYLLWGIALFAVLNLFFNAFIPVITDSFKYSRFGTSTIIFFVAFTAYAITKHHLFDIKVVLTEAAVVIINVVSAVQVFTSGNLVEGILRFLFLAIIMYGSYLLVLSVKREIHQKLEIQRLAKRLDQANRHLEELDELKDNFMSMASHELNTPIAAIEGYLSMIIDEKLAGELNPTLQKYLGSVYISSKRLAALVRDLLNVSRIESGRIHLIYTENQIEDIIEQSIMEVQSKAREKNHELVFHKPEHPLPKTWFDSTRIIEVMINLLGNAIKYTELGGRIQVLTDVGHDKITVCVKDNGRGIPKDKQDKVFQKFVQVDVLKDEVKGTGLGMYISKNLIELHKGKIWFESAGAGKGTKFFFSLPVISKPPYDSHAGEGAVLTLK